jgi:ABC-2 type transport system ATP-binding protein
LSTSAIATRDVRFSYGDRSVLNGVDFDAQAGKITAILGANGAGKSTLLRLLLGLAQPTAGSIQIHGAALSSLSTLQRASIGYVPEHAALYDELSGFENVEYFLAIQPELNKLAENAIATALRRAGLPERAWFERASSYSKGMRQKVMIAAAIARASASNTSPIILLDEPASGLDPSASEELDSLLKHLSLDGATIVIVTHDLASVAALQPQISFLKNGTMQTIDAAQSPLQALRRLYTGDSDASSA